MDDARDAAPADDPRLDLPGDGRRLDRVEELVAEGAERYEEEGEAALDELIQRHPDLASELRAQFDLLRDAGVLQSDDEPEEAAFPERLGKYRLRDRLGGGGMGVVFRAVEEPLGRVVALKLIRPDQLYFEGSRKRFLREVQSVSRLHHPGIVPVYTLEESGGVPFFVMECIEGCTLAEALEDLHGRSHATLRGVDLAEAVARRTPGAVPCPDEETARRHFGDSWWETCFGIVLQIVEALDHAHRRGVFHRDVKPSNIMLTPSGRALLMDFGLAHTAGADKLTRTGHPIGSLPYMAPEVLRGRSTAADPAVDVYSLGVTLYEMLALETPFLREDSESTRSAILAGQPRALRRIDPSLSWEVETVCASAMMPESDQRYATPADFARDLHNVLERRTIVARRPSTWLRGRRWISRHPTLSVLFGCCAIIFLLTVLIAIDRDRSLREIRSTRKERDEATGMLDAFSGEGRILYQVDHMRTLFEDAELLWPSRPELVSAPGGMDDWLERAQAVAGAAAVLRNRTAQFSDGPGPLDVEVRNLGPQARRAWAQADALERWSETVGVETLEGAELARRSEELRRDVGERWLQPIEGDVLRFWHEVVLRDNDQIDRFLDLVHRVQKRRGFAAAIDEVSRAAAPLWAETSEAIASDELYDGFQLSPQWGLRPLGRNPATGLYEFLHLETHYFELDAAGVATFGPWPARDETGALQVGEGTGVVFVLVPQTRAAEVTSPASPFFLADRMMTRAQWNRVEEPLDAWGLEAPPRDALVTPSAVESARLLDRLEMRLPTTTEWSLAMELVAVSRGAADLATWCREPGRPPVTLAPWPHEVPVRGGVQREGRRWSGVRGPDVGLRPARSIDP